MKLRPLAIRWPQPTPRAILATAWVLVLVYAFPGYMNFDVGEQLYEMRRGTVTDFHPPMMGGYWRVFEVFVSGPFPMLLLQTSLYLWGLYTLLAMRLAKTQAAWIAAALVVFPPLLTPMGMIWKDAQMSAFLMAGTALVLKRAHEGPGRREVPRPRKLGLGSLFGVLAWWQRALGVLLLIVAAGVRFNGAAALPFVCLAATSMWLARGRLLALVVAIALTLGIIVAASGINHALTDRRAYNWYRTTLIFDIVGTTCFAPPLSDAELLEILDGVKLSPNTNIQQMFCDRYAPGERVNAPPWYWYSEAFDWNPTKADRQARLRAWKHLVFTYPVAYLKHRLTIATDMMGWNHARLWEPVGQDFAANEEHLRRISHDHKLSWFQRNVGDACRWIAEHTPLYRAYIYFICCLVFLGWALWKRDALVIALTGSGLLYQLSLAVGVNAPDFRYSHWMISCTCLCAVLIAVERIRSRQSRGSSAASTPSVTMPN